MRPEIFITLDFETYWDQEVTLSKLSPIEYVDHPKFEAQSCAVKVGDKPSRVFFGDEIAATFQHIPWEKSAVIGHNMSEFDALILAWKYGVKPAMWCCTLAMARPHFQKEVGGSLRALAQHFGLAEKGDILATDTKGKQLSEFSLAERRALGEYNARDTDITWELFKKLQPMTSPREMALIDTTIRMLVEPQFLLDQALLRTAVQEERTLREVQLLALAGMVGAEDTDELKKILSSSAKFRKLLGSLGVECPMKTSPTTGKEIPALAKTDKGMQELLEHDIPQVQAAAECRLQAKSTLLESRVERMLAAVRPDGRMPIPLRYCGAHQTWRFSGTAKLNMQNLPRVDGRSTDVLRKALVAPEGYKVVVSDLSGIELRVNHFLWGEPHSMALFRQDAKADLYRAYAARLYDCTPDEVTKTQRTFAKVCMLSLGYNTGAKKFRDLARLNGIVLSASAANQTVMQWREVYSQISSAWTKLQDLLPYIRNGDECESVDTWGLFEVVEGGIRFVPRGTVIQYPYLEQGEDGWSFQKEGKQRAKVFGGLMCENLVSHLSRHVMTDVITDLSRTELGKKYPLAHTVHDELVYVVKDEDAEAMFALLNQRLSTPPAWWPDLVTHSEGAIAQSYGGAK